MDNVIFDLGLFVFVLIALAVAFGRVLRPRLAEAIPAFIAFFLLLLGLRMVFGGVHDPGFFRVTGTNLFLGHAKKIAG
jgi:hypothetical protein